MYAYAIVKQKNCSNKKQTLVNGTTVCIGTLHIIRNKEAIQGDKRTNNCWRSLTVMNEIYFFFPT